MHLHNEELKEKFKDFYFNFLPHMKDYTFTDSDNTDVTKDFEVNFDKRFLFSLMSQTLQKVGLQK